MKLFKNMDVKDPDSPLWVFLHLGPVIRVISPLLDYFYHANPDWSSMLLSKVVLNLRTDFVRPLSLSRSRRFRPKLFRGDFAPSCSEFQWNLYMDYVFKCFFFSIVRNWKCKKLRFIWSLYSGYFKTQKGSSLFCT